MIPKYKPIPPDLNRLSGKIVSAAYSVHNELDPGLLENVYEACLSEELTDLGIKFERQVSVPVRYKKVTLETGFRIDLFVEKQLIVELKAVEALLPVHKAQLITYLKLSGCRIGLLINFNVDVLKIGIKRVVL
jgi:GxxExxY protein